MYVLQGSRREKADSCHGRTVAERARLTVVRCGVNDSVRLSLVDEKSMWNAEVDAWVGNEMCNNVKRRIDEKDEGDK